MEKERLKYLSSEFVTTTLSAMYNFARGFVITSIINVQIFPFVAFAAEHKLFHILEAILIK